MRRRRWRALIFAAVGLVVFAFDVLLLGALASVAGLTPFAARLVSLPAAATAGWYLHRRITFNDRRPRRHKRQWSQYLLVNVLSGAANYGVFAALLLASPRLHQLYVLAVIPGAITASTINFVCANVWVFR